MVVSFGKVSAMVRCGLEGKQVPEDVMQSLSLTLLARPGWHHTRGQAKPAWQEAALLIASLVSPRC